WQRRLFYLLLSSPGRQWLPRLHKLGCGDVLV
ncbi:hypothetical protein LINPERPRIM_LOCUS21252, partial [Linum perenne]